MIDRIKAVADLLHKARVEQTTGEIKILLSQGAIVQLFLNTKIL